MNIRTAPQGTAATVLVIAAALTTATRAQSVTDGPGIKLVTGIVSSVSAGRLALVLDREGYAGQHRGTTLFFTVNAGTHILGQQRPATVQAIQPKTQATVAYVQTNGGLVAREVRLLGLAQHMPGEENSQLKKEPSGHFGYFSKSLEPPPSKQPATVPITQLVKLTEVRLQATDRQGAPAIERVRGQVEFYIAFYVQVDAKTPMRLAYQCLRPDLEIRDLKLMRWCTAEEVVPAGFHGVRYRAFPMKYSPVPGSTAGKDLIVAEMAPVITNGNSEVRAFQRKLLPVEVVP